MLTLMPLLCSVTLAFTLGFAFSAADESCSIGGGYNYESLFNSVWRAEIKGHCLRSTNTDCSWYLQFCNKVPINPCGVGHACEVNTSGLDPLSIGTFQKLLPQDHSSFIVRFEEAKGSNETKCVDKKIVLNLIFSCDEKKNIVIGPGAELTKLDYTPLIVSTDCERNVTIPFSGACTPEAPTGGLSAGSVLLILFFIALLVYLIGGILINHNNGARGWEMVPHHQFWSELPGLCVDGCVFFVKYITCQGGPVSYGMPGGGGNRSYDNI
ncbi:cation-dependent mannose-6-phosphate receptor-like [Dermacentor variabilis]|uniref:cation-dependent mannose-6-phosphate receptor-like n=1 Tax=Dermacentor variabilis TaxID=34621 RepID=UPI003F5CAAFA